jgi:hypothetical protein
LVLPFTTQWLAALSHPKFYLFFSGGSLPGGIISPPGSLNRCHRRSLPETEMHPIILRRFFNL